MPTYQAIQPFLELSRHLTIVDVRAPIEFNQGHIPGAVNIPLFSDQERAQIGTLYKQQGRQTSVLQALKIVGPKLHCLAQSVIETSTDKKILVHCWRGGMRSRAFAWLIEQVDFEPVVLEGGYKAYRRHVLESFKQPVGLFVLSGLTGAGKTRQVKLLESLDEHVIDLEKLAHHRGSTFGGIGQDQQPSVEQFENNLNAEIRNKESARRIWVEDESRNIGSVRLPHHFYDRLRSSPAIFMEVDREIRKDLIRQEYGALPQETLIQAVENIRKRLGGQNVQLASQAIESGDLDTAIDVLLDYYDRIYLANKSKMTRDIFVDFTTSDPTSIETTRDLIHLADSVSAN